MHELLHVCKDTPITCANIYSLPLTQSQQPLGAITNKPNPMTAGKHYNFKLITE